MYSLSYSHSDIVHNYTGYLARLFPTVWPWSGQKQFLWSGHCVHEQRMAALFGSTSPPLLHEERGMWGVGWGGGGAQGQAGSSVHAAAAAAAGRAKTD